MNLGLINYAILVLVMWMQISTFSLIITKIFTLQHFAEYTNILPLLTVSMLLHVPALALHPFCFINTQDDDK